MKLFAMLKYISISFFICWTLSSKGQELAVPAPKLLRSVAVGVDVAPFLLKALDSDRTGFGVNSRIGINNLWFLIGEAGFENTSFNRKNLGYDGESILGQFNYKSNGTYLRVGIEKNIFKVDEPGNFDNVLIGFRYGLAFQEHQSSSFTIGNGYWDNYTGSIGADSYVSHWGELIFGIRSEVLTNLFLGWSVRLKILIDSGNSKLLDPYSIPGFGLKNGSVGAGFTYTIEYQLPFKSK